VPRYAYRKSQTECIMFAKIYQPAPSAMQSGRSQSQHWMLEFVSKTPQVIDPLTGTLRSTDMRSQIELTFDSLADAVAYAKKNNIAYRVVKPATTKRIPRGYADNFAYDRKFPWTH